VPLGYSGVIASAQAAEWQDTASYEQWFETSLGRAYAASVSSTVRPWIEKVEPGLVVDVGCGPGITAASVLPSRTRLVELDCTFAMARRAYARLGAEGRDVRSVVGACSEIPLASGVADLILCVNCLEFVEDRQAAFRELGRVLAKGGTAVVGVLNVESPWELTRRIRAPFMRDNGTYYRNARFFRARELREDLEGAGFDVREVVFAVHFPPFRSPVSSFYRACERSLGRWMPGRGAMILARAVARA